MVATNELGYAQWAARGRHQDERLELLREALVSQRNGTQQVALSSQQVAALIDINLPPELSQRWQVVLLAWQSNASPAAPASIANLQDFQTRSYNAPLNVKLTLQYGTSAASETALLDYPANGLTFEVNAARLALSINTQNLVSTTVFTFPLVGAFATPMVGRSKGKVLPTYSSPFVSVPSTGARIFCAPPRAIGYRVFTPETAAYNVNVDECDYAGNIIARDYTAAAATRAAMPQTDWNWLVPRATAIQVTNNDGANARTLQVCWVLDLA